MYKKYTTLISFDESKACQHLKFFIMKRRRPSDYSWKVAVSCL